MNNLPETPSSADKRTFFGLLRHGITEWNEEKRIQGRQNSPLSARGIHDADIWGRSLATSGWQRILSSDLGRAAETTKLVNSHLGLEVSFDHRLRELDWGEWEGVRFETITSRFADEIEKQVQAGWDFRAPGGESRKECLLRARAALKDAAAKWPQQHILVICHHGVIKCLVLAALGNSFLPCDAVELEKNGLHVLSLLENDCTCEQLNIQPDSL